MFKLTARIQPNYRFSLVWLVLICLLAFAVRFTQVNSLPSALNRDEAAIGYNALLLAETGRDEWGRSWPIALESFGDYKLPGYVWVTALVGKLFGWEDWVVRLPSVLAGTLLPLAGYFWLRQSGQGLKTSLALATILAVAPFSWFYSRMAFEANLALTFWVFWLGLIARKKRFLALGKTDAKLEILIWFFAISSILTYNTPLLLLPFILLALPFYFGLKLWRNWLVAWLGLVLITTLGFYGLTQLFGQKSAVTLFSDPTTWTEYINQRPSASILTSSWWGFLCFRILQNFWASISPEFLITKGGAHPWHNLPGLSHIYWTIYFSAGVGIFTTLLRSLRIIKSKPWLWLQSTQAWWLFLTAISLLPAVITVDAPHATRSLLFFCLIHVWAAVGLSWVWRKLIKYQPSFLRFFVFGVVVLLCAEINYYSQRYFDFYPTRQEIFQPGIPAAIKKINEVSPYLPVAVVGDGYAYASWAWYLKMPPQEFFMTVVKQLPDRIGFRYGEKIGRFHFIAAASDKLPSEQILVEWRENAWQITTF